MSLLEAKGSELEQQFAFGVVRELLEGPVSNESEHSGLFADGAGPAARLFDPDEQRLTTSDVGFEALHSLYWLAVNLADQAPVIPKAEKGTDMTVYVGGSTASNVDLASDISGKLLRQILVVIALELPAAGARVPRGRRAAPGRRHEPALDRCGVRRPDGDVPARLAARRDRSGGPVPIVSYVPLFMFAVLFGLSMDYEVFLVSQIKEHADAGEDTKTAVVSGLVTSGRVITAAATIMVFVFGSFVLNGDPTVKQFGVGLAVAVILDATVVRCLLVPARMVSLGKWNWYLPRWLERCCPTSTSREPATSVHMTSVSATSSWRHNRSSSLAPGLASSRVMAFSRSRGIGRARWPECCRRRRSARRAVRCWPR